MKSKQNKIYEKLSKYTINKSGILLFRFVKKTSNKGLICPMIAHVGYSYAISMKSKSICMFFIVEDCF